jgi:hypothetical protein
VSLVYKSDYRKGILYGDHKLVIHANTVLLPIFAEWLVMELGVVRGRKLQSAKYEALLSMQLQYK